MSAAAVLVLLVVGASPAAAETTRQLQSQITGAGSPPAPFLELAGLTTDSAGRLWATDYGRHAVDRFSPAGAYEAQNVGAGSWAESTEVRSLAFSAAAAEVFAADSANEGHLFGLDPATAASSGKDLALALGGAIQVAADNSAGATGGDLYVSNGAKLIRIKASDGSADPFTCSVGPDCVVAGNEMTGPFTEAGPLAVAPNGNFYVAAPSEPKIYEFEPSGKFTGIEFSEAGEPLEGFGSIRVIAVDPTSGNLLVATGDNRVFEFTSAGAYLREIKKPGGGEFLGVEGLAVGASGAAYVAEASGEATKQIDVFSPLLTLPEPATGPATVHSTTEATVTGEVNPANTQLTECFFEYGPTTAYGHVAECEPEASEIPVDENEHPVEAQLIGLTPGLEYHYRLVAANAEGANKESEDRVFFTGASIDSTSVSGVSATAATLETELNPHGLPTTYHFEYDTAPYVEGGPGHGISVPIPDGSAGSGEADVTRTALIQGLQPLTTYHFRVVATNSLGTTEGPDRSFATQGPATSQLPDGRGYEMVSPPDKHGVPLEALAQNGGMVQAAADGSGFAYIALGPIGTEPPGTRSGWFSQLLAARSASGWTTTDITPPNQHPVQASPSQRGDYFLFSPDLSRAFLSPIGGTPLSPLATEKTPYLHQSDGSFTPLVYPGNVPAGTKFGGLETGSEGFQTPINPITATPDLSHVILGSSQLLTSEFGPTYDPPDYTGQQNIYEWTAGTLTLASFVPSGTGTICGGTGPACVPASEEGMYSTVGIGDRQLRNVLSADGSRLVFRADKLGSDHLYLRDISRGETLQLDAAEPGCVSCQGGTGEYQLASKDGSHIFFTSISRLTADSTAKGGKPDLYECRILEEAGHLACDLTDLTVNAVDPSEPAAVQGLVLAASDDASYLYFVATGDLTGSQANPGGETAQGGQPNLYLSHEGATSFIATLSPNDAPVWGHGPSAAEALARISPDGRYLTFMSERPLTGYDNRDLVSGQRDQEVFLYDAQANGGQGQLLCPSCNPAGARPHGVEVPDYPGLLVDRQLTWVGHRLAASIPGSSRLSQGSALYQTNYLSDSGRLFFDAADALAPSDTNGVMDVYEYEPPAVGGCTESMPAYVPAAGGCISLISSGTSSEESAFLDASESGDDVFFLTASKLVTKDVDSALDIYDASVDGGESQVVKPVECTGDACQQPAVPPLDATPGSLTFIGAGNLFECSKDKVKRGAKCVKQKSKKRKHSKKKDHKKRSHKRAGSKHGRHK